MKCIACNGNLRHFGKSGNHAIYICNKCGLGATSDFFSQTGNYHRDDVYISETSQFKNIFTRRVNLILKHIGKGKVLEIGSSTGVFLGLLKEKGFEVLGIEPSKSTAGFANKKGINTLKTTFEEEKIASSSFDLVIMNHVLEHMEDPVAVLEKAKRVLKTGGLVFIDVPNFASLSAKLWGVNWRYLLPNEHKFHFTPQSLDKLLEKAGLKIIYWEATSGVWDYASPLQELWQSLKNRKKRFFVNFLTLIPTLFISKFKMGTGLIMIARKKNA